MEDTSAHIVQENLVHGRYMGESAWVVPENRSSYYDYNIDRQGVVPSRSFEELDKELSS